MNPPRITLAEAQRREAEMYRRAERQAPWNSDTRRGWRLLAEAAEAIAKAEGGAS